MKCTASGRAIPADFDPAELRPPRRWELVREARVVLERLALRLQVRRLIAAAPRGRGEPVLVVPGFAADDGWTARLRDFLAAIGYETLGWGLGRNRGNVAKLVPALAERVAAVAAEHGAPLRLIGWSLGGYLAREAARERPELVERVITLGAPVVGGPSYTASAPLYLRKGYDLGEIGAAVLERELRPITVPVFAVFSRADGVVAWRACIDTFANPRVEHHELHSSHLGLVGSPRAFALVAELLARKPSP